MLKNAMAYLLLVGFVAISGFITVQTAKVVAKVAQMQFEHNFTLAHSLK